MRISSILPFAAIGLLSACVTQSPPPVVSDVVFETLSQNACSTPLIQGAPLDWPTMPVNIYAPTAEDGVSPAEADLYALLMQARATAGLPAIPISPALTLVAGRHAADVSRNILGRGGDFAPGANAHSWSDLPYFGDHSTPRVMWQSPRRLGTGYCGRGYEIAADRFGSVGQVASAWMGSDLHRPVILNQGPWADKTWRAIGIGVVQASSAGPAIYYVIFGDETDTTGGMAAPEG